MQAETNKRKVQTQNGSGRPSKSRKFDWAAAHHAVPTVVPRFSVDDPAGYEYLAENGYVVFKNVASEEELETGRSLAWDFLEGLEAGIDRNDIETWNSGGWPDPFGNGIVCRDSVGQSEFLWFSRGLPSVQKIYSTIWNTPNLITSFDGFCIHRPYEHNSAWLTKGISGYHFDQNGHTKPDKLCVQGFLNYYDAMEEDGGLVVVPRSHTIFNSVFKKRPHLANRGDWIVLHKDRSMWEKELPEAGLQPIKVCAKAGDFVVWDSRTMHCNASATSEREVPLEGFLPPRRLVAYICMTPADRLSKEIKEKRVLAFRQGLTSTHWPEECNIARGRKRSLSSYVPPQLSDEQKRLIPL
eukprot:CAMPEP_0174273026 /NCGR_PEP_ID=MMETSP0439-20130205/53085_1 /TAXON_ID=0 /ORGANISM="Stereomyxa ramosa, Strain Chinc5" /LENGTH=353 /DNA_ID=CAMNT_0015363915 /DNA_START=17 /DNA_END=1078 /DNA_ORIENTATION=-